MICDEDLTKICANLSMYNYKTKPGSRNTLAINEAGNPLYGISLDLNDIPRVSKERIFGISYRYLVGIEALFVFSISNNWLSLVHSLTTLDLSILLGVVFVLIAITRMHNSLLVMRMVALREVERILATRKAQ
jgi:hypothetical protein